MPLPASAPAPQPLHVLFLVHGFGIGGLETAVAHLVNHCDRKRFRFSVCALTTLGGAQDLIQRGDTQFYALDKPLGNDWSLVPRIARILKDHAVDVVQTHDWGTYLEGLLAARLARVPVCIHVEQGTPHWDHWRRRAGYRLAQRLTDRFVVVSERLRQDMIERVNVSPSKIVLISNAVETDRFVRRPERRAELRAHLGITGAEFVVGSVGRLVPVKGYDVLIRAMAALKERGAPVRLLLIGQGPLYQPLQQMVQELDLSQHVLFLGERSDVADLLNVLDVYVSSSLSEGRSLSIMEAMAASLPIVATAVGGTPEILSDGQTGLLIPPSDPEALSAKLLALMQDPQRRLRMGAAARQTALAFFDVRRMADCYEQLYIASRMGIKTAG